MNLQDTGSFLETGQYTFIERVGRVRDDPHYLSFGHNLMQHLDLFVRHCLFRQADAGKVAARSVETGDKASGDGIGTRDEYNRNGCGRRLCREHSRKAECRNRGHVALDQFGGEGWQSIVMPLRVAVFYRDVLTLDIAHSGKTGAERGEIGGEFVSRSTVEEAITGIAFCCARRARADTIVPPSIAIKTRRRISNTLIGANEDVAIRIPVLSSHCKRHSVTTASAAEAPVTLSSCGVGQPRHERLG